MSFFTSRGDNEIAHLVGSSSNGQVNFELRLSTFYPVEGKIDNLPYAIFISAGNDATGALSSICRIANGYPFKEVHEPIIAKGDVTEDTLAACEELGMTLAAGLEVGIF